VPGFLVHLGVQVTCAHAGQATPTTPNPRVVVSGQPTVLVTSPYAVTGCPLPPPPAANGPCVIAQPIPPTGTLRVFSNGQPLLVQSSQAICAPSGTPVIIGVTQTRVAAL
jgi:hypothetical protein